MTREEYFANLKAAEDALHYGVGKKDGGNTGSYDRKNTKTVAELYAENHRIENNLNEPYEKRVKAMHENANIDYKTAPINMTNRVLNNKEFQSKMYDIAKSKTPLKIGLTLVEKLFGKQAAINTALTSLLQYGRLKDKVEIKAINKRIEIDQESRKKIESNAKNDLHEEIRKAKSLSKNKK